MCLPPLPSASPPREESVVVSVINLFDFIVSFSIVFCLDYFFNHYSQITNHKSTHPSIRPIIQYSNFPIFHYSNHPPFLPSTKKAFSQVKEKAFYRNKSFFNYFLLK